jgi:diguanylate cyclase (GGDEF)-like protein
MSTTDGQISDLRAAPPEQAPRTHWRRPAVFLVAAITTLLIGACLLANAISGEDSELSSLVSNLAQLAAAALATVTAAIAVRRRRSRSDRRVWLLVTVACACWTAGQAYWTYVELVLGQEVAPVSIADLFFLTFSALMVVAVAPTRGIGTDRLRTLLDAFVIGMSLFTISWSTSINEITRSAGDDTDTLALLVNLAYPCFDTVVLTMVILNVSRRTGQRSSLTAVAIGMGLIAVSDGFYAYLAASDSFSSGSVVGLGWVAGFGMMGCAAMASTDGSTPRVPVSAGRHEEFHVRPVSALPYVPLVLALLVVGINRLNDVVDRVSGIALVLTFFGVLARQYLTIKDNVTLTRVLEKRETELARQAFQDILTGLPNRALFIDRATHALEQHRRSLRPLALMFVDLDDFKAVNDTLGHPVGDQLVIRVAERLRGAIRSSDTVARFGGDEFAVLAEGEDTDGVELGSRLAESLRPQFTLGKEQLSIGASIGIAEVKADQLTPTLDELFSRADIAMYSAKRAGKGQLALYEPSMVLPEAADLRYRPLLIEAIWNGAIECVYQPILDLSSGRVHCMEALARWLVDGQPVRQDYFIKLAGRLKLLPALTDLMVERACAQLADWSARLGRDDLQVGVNVPPGLMTDREFPRRIAASLQRHHLAADRLVLEITEDALLGELAVARAVADQLRRAGVQLWLDDFGTGYSSLLSLRQISLQAVKIDIAFVANIHTDPSAAQFLRALLALGRDLELSVTAEGVELPEQAAVLRELGCPFVQGFLYARPAPADQFDALLTGGYRGSGSGHGHGHGDSGEVGAAPVERAVARPAEPTGLAGIVDPTGPDQPAQVDLGAVSRT